MAAPSESQKMRRKPTTYGKASRRALFGLQSSISPAESDCADDEIARGLVRLGGRKRKDVTMPKCISSPGSSGSSAGGTHTLTATSSVPSLRPSDDDLYDIPSSDENRPSKKVRPTAKKRKAQTKPHVQEPAETSNKMVGSARTTSTPRNLLPSPMISIAKRPRPSAGTKEQVVDAGRQLQGELQASQSSSGFSRSSVSRIPKAGTRQESHTQNFSEPRLLKLQSPANKLRRAQRSDSRDKEYNHESKRGTIEMARKHVEGSDLVYTISEPRTPPQTLVERSQVGSPNLPWKLSGAIESYLSPSGLDLRGMQLLESSQPASQTTPHRGKLKDRLIAKNGVQRTDESDSACEDGEDDNMELDTQETPVELTENGNVLDFGVEHIPVSSQGTNTQSSAIVPKLVKSNGPKFTYAARQRTLRKEESTDDALLSLGMEDGDGSAKSSTRRLNTRSTMNASQSTVFDIESDSETATQTGALRTIHELRQAGGNARFFGQLEAILDDIDSTTLNLKRSGLMELATRLQDSSFRGQFIANGLEMRLLSQVQSTTDPLAEFLLASSFLEVLVAVNTSHVLTQFSERPLLDFFSRLLRRNSDIKTILKEQKSTTKAFQKDMLKLTDLLLKSNFWRNSKPPNITPRILSLQCMEYLVRHIREARSTEEVLDQGLTDDLMEILETGIREPEDSSAKNLTDVKIALSILESSAVASININQQAEGIWSRHSLKCAARFLTWIYQSQESNIGSIRALALRLCLNLTNNNPAACKPFSTNEIVEALVHGIDFGFEHVVAEVPVENQGLMLDNLVLSLGFLGNLVENNEKAKKLFLVPYDKSSTPLDTLLQVFVSKWQRAFEVVEEGESMITVPIGYLAVLLSHLSLEASIRAHVISRLEGGTLKHLLVAMDNFISIYRKAEEIHTAEGEVDVNAQFVVRLQAVVDKLKLEDRKGYLDD